MNSSLSLQRLCVVTAVDLEFKIASGLLSERTYGDNANYCRGIAGGRPITILKSGMGAVGFLPRFEIHLQANIYDGLVIAGFAGALDPDLKVGEAIIYDRCLAAGAQDLAQTRFETTPTDLPFSATVFERLAGGGLSCRRGSGLSLDRILTRAEEKLLLGRRYDAQAVDMESFEIASHCHMRGVRAAVVRVISDDANSDLPDFPRAFNRNGGVIPAQMARVMLARPVRSAYFLHNLRTAASSLRKCLQAIYFGKAPQLVQPAGTQPTGP
jgi:adenosylhomocysteine nucleosidase